MTKLDDMLEDVTHSIECYCSNPYADSWDFKAELEKFSYYNGVNSYDEKELKTLINATELICRYGGDDAAKIAIQIFWVAFLDLIGEN